MIFDFLKTNADISLVRSLDSSNLDPTTGKVSCAFKGNNAGASVCPVASSIGFAVEFLNDDVWLVSLHILRKIRGISLPVFSHRRDFLVYCIQNEFKIVLDTMTTNGYVRPSSTCANSACRLTPA